MNTDQVKEQFDFIAEKYDRQRRYFIPCFDDFYKTSISLLKSYRYSFDNIVDLGAGTGLLTMEIFKMYSYSNFTLIDISPEMLSIAKERFNGLDNFEYVEGDYTEDIPINTCSLICSALSIHHLEKPDRKQLYSTIFKKLDKGGCFINLDLFMAASPRINNLYTDWINYYTNKTGINGGAKTTKAKRQLLDKESTVRETIDLLKKCGFEDVECVYSFMKFGTIIAIKE